MIFIFDYFTMYLLKDVLFEKDNIIGICFGCVTVAREQFLYIVLSRGSMHILAHTITQYIYHHVRHCRLLLI